MTGGEGGAAAGREPTATPPIPERDAQLAMALRILRDQLGPIIEEIKGGVFDLEDRRELRRVLAALVADLIQPLALPNPLVANPPPWPLANSGPGREQP